MNEFIGSHPGVAVGLLSFLLVLIAALLAIIGWFGKRLISELTEALQELKEALKVHGADIGGLKDRMQHRDTVCEMQLARCPHSGRMRADDVADYREQRMCSIYPPLTEA